MLTGLIFIIKAVIIGIVEGITEFLPISSTGHMIIVGHFINFEGDFAKLFEIVIQLGAILAVVFLYKKKILGSFSSLKPGGEGFRLWTNLAVGFIPAGVIGLILHKKIEDHLMVPVVVAAAMLVGGIWLIAAENKYRKNYKIDSIDKIGYKQALIIGCFQCLSVVWPGFSRSGATIIGGWSLGLSTGAAAEFSFFLAIPTMFIATFYELLKTKVAMNGTEILALIIGFIVSFVVAFFVVEKFINFLKKRPMRIFGIYRIIVGSGFLILAVFKVL